MWLEALRIGCWRKCGPSRRPRDRPGAREKKQAVSRGILLQEDEAGLDASHSLAQVAEWGGGWGVKMGLTYHL
jgi:hypothetical protein